MTLEDFYNGTWAVGRYSVRWYAGTQYAGTQYAVRRQQCDLVGARSLS